MTMLAAPPAPMAWMAQTVPARTVAVLARTLTVFARIAFALVLLAGIARADGMAPTAASAAPAAAPPVTTVIELFTSQGCSSCPAADRLLATYAARPGTLALAWHVDYWNYLGWRDTFSDAAFSRRQRLYARRMGGGVYTPQVVVNGAAEAVGSAGDVARLAQDASTLPLLPLTLERGGPERGADGREGGGGGEESLRVRLGGTTAQRRAAEGAVLVLVRFAREARVSIRRGENRGRTATFRNVVRRVEPVGQVAGAVLDMRLHLTLAPDEGCALLLQAATDDGPGPVLAAAVVR